MEEEWKIIDGLNEYEVSNHGRLRSKTRWIDLQLTKGRLIKECILKVFKNKKGYLRISLRGKNYRIHRLVANAFVPNPDNLPQVNHKDGNKLNNHYLNLEWCTNSHNTAHAMAELPRRRYKQVISEKTKKDILQMSLNGVSQRKIAKDFNVSQYAIWRVVKRQK